MERLAHVAERLDGPLGDRTAIAGNLRDLRRVNRFLGGSRLSIQALGCVTAEAREPRERLRILDVGTGSADIPLALLAADVKIEISQIVAVDRSPDVLAAARVLDRGLDSKPGLEIAIADATSLPYSDRSFDIAHASLLVHHLEPAAARLLMSEMARVARVGVIVNDLVRSTPSWLAAWLLAHVLSGNPLTRHDAPLSVRRAYTLAELREFAQTAGLRVVGSFRGPFGHRWALALRPGVPPASADVGAFLSPPHGELDAQTELEEPE
jgi:ubiquinone/menaquinone biosynthesis C-methylase UbiE